MPRTKDYVLDHLSTFLVVVPGVVALIDVGFALAHASLVSLSLQHVLRVLLH